MPGWQRMSDAKAGRELTDDAFLGGRLHLLQPRKGVRAGIDAVFLAAAIPAAAGDHVLEAGIGAGAASLCLAARVTGLALTGAEIDAGAAALARLNAGRNRVSGLTVIEADVTARGAVLAGQGILADAYDHVLANPPFYDVEAGSLSPLPGKSGAHAHRRGGLAAWIDFLVRCLKPRGTLTLVHRPEALAVILAGLEGRAGAVSLRPLYPRPGAPAHRVLVRAVKASRAPLRLLPGLALQDEGGRYSKAAEAVLRHGEAFDLG